MSCGVPVELGVVAGLHLSSRMRMVAACILGLPQCLWRGVPDLSFASDVGSHRLRHVF